MVLGHPLGFNALAWYSPVWQLRLWRSPVPRKGVSSIQGEMFFLHQQVIMSIKYDRDRASYLVMVDSERSIRFTKFVDAVRFMGAIK